MSISWADTKTYLYKKKKASALFWNEVREYIKEQVHSDNNILSYEALTEWSDDDDNPKRYEPASPETTENTVLLRIAIDQLIEEIRAIDPIYGIVLDLIKAGYERKEIVKKLDLSKSQAYKKIAEAHVLAKELYYK